MASSTKITKFQRRWKRDKLNRNRKKKFRTTLIERTEQLRSLLKQVGL